MPERSQLPDLQFPDVNFGSRETPWNMNVLLYKGGASANLRKVGRLADGGMLGAPLVERLDLVSMLHEEINAAIGSGGPRGTTSAQLQCLRQFFAFADRTNCPLTVDTVTDSYCEWAESLFQRTRASKRARESGNHRDQQAISMRTAYGWGAMVGRLLDRVLQRRSRLLEMTRLESPRRRKSAVGVQAEKQSLAETFRFGSLLQDLCDQLTVQTICEARLPIEIQLRSGEVLAWTGRKAALSKTGKATSPGLRLPLAHLRMEAELFMLVAQTGLNLTQARNLDLGDFFYVGHLDGYQVKEYKKRRGGVVLFEIFKDYKSHFERYLGWRRHLFPDSERLFPFVGIGGSRPDSRCDGGRLRAICRALDLRFVCPRLLRNTRVNWLLRTTADPDLTAEMAQHAKQTMLAAYERPSLQRAMAEVVRFWSEFDPHLAKTQPVAPGGCNGIPKNITHIPKAAPKPNCMRPSGCLWCENHRDVDSPDYIWALATFKHLKTIELGRTSSLQCDADIPPAKLAIDRIKAKLHWFEESTAARQEWVREALARIAEGYFHPSMRDEIRELEGTAWMR